MAKEICFARYSDGFFYPAYLLEKPSPLKVRIQYIEDQELRILPDNHKHILKFNNIPIGQTCMAKIGQHFKEVKILSMKAIRDPT